MYVLGTNKLKMHTTGVPTFKKKKIKKKIKKIKDHTSLQGSVTITQQL